MNKAEFKFALKDNKRSITNIAYGLFILGIIIGVMGAIWYDTASLDFTLVLPLIFGSVPALFFIMKGIRAFTLLPSKKTPSTS